MVSVSALAAMTFILRSGAAPVARDAAQEAGIVVPVSVSDVKILVQPENGSNREGKKVLLGDNSDMGPMPPLIILDKSAAQLGRAYP